MELFSDYEVAFAGMAVRQNREVEAYYWRHLASEIRAKHPSDWKYQLDAVALMPIVLITIPERYWYWRQVNRRNIIAHQHCHGALLGVGRMPGEPLVSVYSKQKIREGPYSIVASSRTSPGTSLSPAVTDKMADIWIKQALIDVDFGEKSPYYVP